MTEKDIIKKIIRIVILLVLLVVGYIFIKPYMPTIESKYQQLSNSIMSVFNDEPTTLESSTETEMSEQVESSSESRIDSSVETTDESSTTETSTEKSESEINTQTSIETTQEVKQKKIDFEKYLTFNFSGFDGKGTIDYTLDQEEAKKEWDLSSKEWDEFINGFDISFNPNSNLKNGQDITVTLTVADKYQDIPIKSTLKTKVEGLRKQPVFSRQAIERALDIQYHGFSGTGSIVLDYSFAPPFDNLELYVENPKETYANKDKITVSLTETSRKALEDKDYIVENGGKVQVELNKFEEPEFISTDLINKHVVVTFLGTSGVGKARIDTTFQPPYSDFLNNDSFVVENNGAIKNDDMVKISVAPEIVDKMKAKGLILENNGLIERKADNMLEVSQTLKEIKNWETLIQKVDDKMKQKYPDTLFGAYDIKIERYYYRPFHTANDLIQIENTTLDGTIIGIYTVNTYDRDKKTLRNTEREVFGFTELFINENHEVKLDGMTEYSYKFDNSYSLDAVYQIIEGYNFKAVKLKP